MHTLPPRRPRTPYSYRSVQSTARPKRSHGKRVLVITVVFVLVALGGYFGYGHYAHANKAVVVQSAPPTVATKPSTTSPVSSPPAAVNHCADNQAGHTILVSISARHLWACDGTTQAYGSPVITGNMNVVSDATPTGTFHIYAKQSDTTLTGPSWNDPVKHWMPFYDNQYGAYGFHDATWRDNNAFGNVSPTTSDASHGCVELPLAASNWLYQWASIGTAVTIST